MNRVQDCSELRVSRASVLRLLGFGADEVYGFGLGPKLYHVHPEYYHIGIGASIVRIWPGFRGPLCYSHNEKPLKSY